MLGADIVRGYGFSLALIGVGLGVVGCIATYYERLRRKPAAPAQATALASFID
jgi:hypothetical protein